MLKFIVLAAGVMAAQAAHADDAVDKLSKCLRQAIPLLDDGRSDASTVARAADAKCLSEVTGFVTSMKNMPGNRATRADLGSLVTSITEEAVLNYRAQLRAQGERVRPSSLTGGICTVDSTAAESAKPLCPPRPSS